MNSEKASGVEGVGFSPRSVSFLLISGFLSALVIEAFKVLRIESGVSDLTKIPNHDLERNGVPVASSKVGTSGKLGSLFSEAIAKACIFPSFTKGTTMGRSLSMQSSRPRILFFDEATSALDNHTQATVTNSLEQFKSTRIVIAHRMSTIVKADRIIVLAGGKIIQDGSYEQLMSVDGLFKELASRQTT